MLAQSWAGEVDRLGKLIDEADEVDPEMAGQYLDAVERMGEVATYTKAIQTTAARATSARRLSDSGPANRNTSPLASGRSSAALTARMTSPAYTGCSRLAARKAK